jgi:HEAT repeat protein
MLWSGGMKPTTAFLVVATLSGSAWAGEARWRGSDEPYLATVHERVHPRWTTFLTQLERIPPGSRYHERSLAAEVVLAVDADGTIGKVEETASAGLKGFDDAPIDLVRDLGKLPPPPRDLQSDDGRVYLRWRFLRAQPGCEQSAVIERRLPVEEAVPRLVQSGHAEEAVARVEELFRDDPARAPAMLLVLTDQLGRVGATDRDPERRAAATAILGHLDGTEAQLLALAHDDVTDVRHEALLGLAEQPRSKGAIAAVVAALATPSDREVAARALSRLGDPSAIAPLRALLVAGEIPDEAAAALVARGDRESVAREASQLLQSTPAKRIVGARIARQLAQPSLLSSLMAAYSGAGEELRAELVEALGAVGEHDSEARLQVLRAIGDPSAKVRAHAATALAALDPHAPAVRMRLVDTLGDADPGVRAAAAASLAAIGADSEDIAWELGRLVRDPAPSVRIAVGEALLAHPAKASAFVMARLRKDPDTEVRQALSLAGLRFPSSDVSPERVLNATDTVELLRAAAAWRAAHENGPRAQGAHRSDG